MTDDVFLTPQLRTGPSSRLLKRRSHMNHPKMDVSPPNRDESANLVEVTRLATGNFDFNVSLAVLKIAILVLTSLLTFSLRTYPTKLQT